MENIRKTNQTWVIKNAKGEVITTTSRDTLQENRAIYYGKLKDIVKLITYKEYREMATLEVCNKGFDNTNHKPITKEEIERLLEEA